MDSPARPALSAAISGWSAKKRRTSALVKSGLCGYSRARHPTVPWRWRADWDTGRIPCETRATALGILFFAVIWNAFCVPMLWAVSSQEQPFVWLFVIAGAGLAIAAGVLTWRWLRFGRTVFEQTTLPGRLGDRLRGTIHPCCAAGSSRRRGFAPRSLASASPAERTASR